MKYSVKQVRDCYTAFKDASYALEKMKAAVREEIPGILEMDGPQTPGELAATTGLSIPAVCAELDKLEKAGRVSHEKRCITRFFAEVDEDGNFVPNGITKQEHTKRTFYFSSHCSDAGTPSTKRRKRSR